MSRRGPLTKGICPSIQKAKFLNAKCTEKQCTINKYIKLKKLEVYPRSSAKCQSVFTASFGAAAWIFRSNLLLRRYSLQGCLLLPFSHTLTLSLSPPSPTLSNRRLALFGFSLVAASRRCRVTWCLRGFAQRRRLRAGGDGVW